MQLMAAIGAPGCPFSKGLAGVMRAQVLFLMVGGGLGMSQLLILVDTRHTSRKDRQTWLLSSLGPIPYKWPYAMPCHALPGLCSSCSAFALLSLLREGSAGPPCRRESDLHAEARYRLSCLKSSRVQNLVSKSSLNCT